MSDWSSDVCSSDLVVFVEHVELDGAQRLLRLGHQPPQAAEATGVGEHLHRLGVGGHDGAVVDGDLLGPKQQLGGAQPQGIGLALQHGAGDDVGELVDEQIGEHTSELQSLMRISYAVFCLKKKKKKKTTK